MISPLASYAGLTRAAAGTPPGQLRMLYPEGRRTFLRVVPADDRQVGALALLARARGGAPVYVLDDGDDEYGRPMASQFATAARRSRLSVAGRASWNPAARSQRRLAERVARAHPRAVFLGGRLDTGGAEVVRALRARLGPDVLLLGPDGFTPVTGLTGHAGAAARGMRIALPGVAGVEQLGRAARGFARELRRTLGAEPEPSALYAAAAMEVALDALARSDGTRASMLKALFRTRIDNAPLGPVSFDRNGDIESNAVTVLRVAPGARSVRDLADVVVDSVQRVPSSLVP
jgi:branched-chain amino acid transport system substrate-binding protein